VIAQALTSASHTINPPLGLHSQHCYFLLPADSSIPINYEVERLRDGKSYATRLVKAIQREQAVFILIASYTSPPVELPPIRDGPNIPFSWVPSREALSHSLRFALGNASESGQKIEARQTTETDEIVSPFGFRPRFAIPFPDGVLPWEKCEEEEVRWSRFLDRPQGHDGTSRAAVEEYIKERKESPVSISVARIDAPRDAIIAAGPQRRMLWLKARLQSHEKPDTETIKAMIAYMSDFQFIGTASRAVGLTRVSQPRLGMLASLDHSTHFYPLPPDFDLASPLLHVMEATITDVPSGRGVVRGLLYTKDGTLVATALQEGVVRADVSGKKKERGLVEGGAVGDEDEGNRPIKPKL